MEDIIKLEGVSYSYYGRIKALEDISLSVRESEKFGIIGANGSGKSSLMRVISGLIEPSSGKVSYRGTELSGQRLKDRGFLRYFRERVGYVFQDPDVQLFCPTVLDELLYGPLQLGLSDEESSGRASEVMAILGIEGLKDRPPYMLSTGEKKRVAIGSVLTMNPETILFDEPTAGLDPRTQCLLVELIFGLHESGKTIVIATHDLALIEELQLKVAVLNEGHRIETTGTSEEVLGDEALLLRVNLIHEHIHLHGPALHRHPHYFFHRHSGGPNTG